MKYYARIDLLAKQHFKRLHCPVERLVLNPQNFLSYHPRVSWYIHSLSPQLSARRDRVLHQLPRDSTIDLKVEKPPDGVVVLKIVMHNVDQMVRVRDFMDQLGRGLGSRVVNPCPLGPKFKGFLLWDCIDLKQARSWHWCTECLWKAGNERRRSWSAICTVSW